MPSPASAAFFSEVFPSPSAGGGFSKVSERTRSSISLAATALLLTLLLLLSATAFGAMTVDNRAKASYSVGPLPVAVDSNLASIVVRTPSTIDFLEYAPLASGAKTENVQATSYLASGGYTPLPAPVPLGAAAPLDLSRPVPLVETAVYHENEPIFIRLTDLDQNLAPSVRETVVVTLTLNNNSDSETLLLTETGPDTGVFAGSIQSTGGAAVAGNGQLTVGQNSTIQARYTDPVDGTDNSKTAALVDPFGIVFDSATGKPVDGATVTLVDAATGQPATILGDDGVSAFPATVTSGGTTSDSSERNYIFPPGGFRFPFVTPGDYKFKVTPPPGYVAPSTATDSALQALPGGPFSLVRGSRLEQFSINPGPAIHIDIPLDPLTAPLWLRKSAGRDSVAIGDFLPYQLDLQNSDAVVTATGVKITDTLPLGFRYRKGSTRLNGAAAPDPAISPDGRTLTFAVGDLAPQAAANVRYVVEVAAGARPGAATNRAIARSAAGAASNQAAATVQVRSDFLDTRSFIMGEVLAGACGASKEEKPGGVEGVRILLEDGTYVVTDKNGMYHFEGVKPGTHVVQLDLASVPEKYEVVACEENSRFAGSAHSQFVDLQGGTLWRADFHLRLKPATAGEAGLELRSVLKKSEAGSETVEYGIPVRIGSVPVRNLRLTVMLPDGFVYQPGTSSLNGVPRPDPSNMENALTFKLGELPANWEGTVRFSAAVPLAGKACELATRALLTFDTPVKKNERTPVADNILVRKSVEERHVLPDIVLHPRFANLSAELSEEDKAVLDRLLELMKQSGVKQITVTGHTDSNPILGRGMEKFRDNYLLSEARAKTVGHYIANALKLAPEQVTCIGRGPDEPVAANETDEGRARNRRVELTVKNDKLVVSNELRNEKDQSGVKRVATVGLRPGEKWAAAEANKGAADGKEMPDYNAAWLDTVEPGAAWLWPAEGHHPPIPSVKLAVKYDPRRKLKLFLNGAEVDPLYLDETVKSRDNKVAVAVWRGVHVEDGDNLFEAVQFDETGAETARLKRVIHYSTSPVRAEFVPAKSRLAADGKNPPAIAVRLTDKDGHPAREGVIGEYLLDPPYASRQRGDELQKNPLTAQAADKQKYQVGEDGIALIELQPTTKAGEAVVRLNLASGQQEVRAWLRPEYRDWILVGLAEGTVGYNVVAKNMESAAAAGVEDDLYEKDSRVAFYAKGAIKGEWLLTIAYDSGKKSTGSSGNSLFQTIDPNSFYTLYGDATQQQYDAASAEKLYLKIERDQFYALFGDFNTGLTVTELSRYSRSLTGFKSEYQGRNLEFNLFASETGQSFVKDEIQGDGTSGLYRLSRGNVVLNSDKITIQVRDRFRSEVILSTRTLARYTDYSIDYDAGTIFFKEPIRSRDENFNPIFIVVDYETRDVGSESMNYGGRVGIKSDDQRLRGGFTHIHEGQVTGEGNSYGVDASWQINQSTRAKAELARTDSAFSGVEREGNAWLAEIEHRSPKLEARAYYRELEEGFGLGQQNGSEAGTRKAGGEATWRLADSLSLGGQAYRQYNLATGGVRDVVEGKSSYSSGAYGAQLGFRHASDRLGDGSDRSSEQLTMGASWLTLQKRLTLHAEHDQSIGGNANADFPTRTTFGADFKATDKVTLFAAQEFTSGDSADTSNTRAGMKSTPWEGGSVNTSMERNLNENSDRLFALFGLKQVWKVTDKWSVDAGLDRSQTVRKASNYSFNVNVPPASGGNEDFTAISLGTGYQEKKWNSSARLELRTADNEDKWGFLASFVGEPREGWGWSARFQLFDSESTAGDRKTSADLRLGFAHRPRLTSWIVLDRLDLIFDRQAGSAQSLESRRMVNNLLLNWRPVRETQFSLLYGAKYVLETIDDADYSGYTDLLGLEWRHDLTRKWDVGLRGSVLHSWSAGQASFSAGPSVGYNVVENAWVSLGYNIMGFTDRDFSAADYTAQGPFVKFRFKFDQNSVRDAVKWIGYQ